MELRRYLDLIAPYRWLLVIAPLLAAVVAFGATYAVQPRFTSVAVVQLILDEIEPQSITLRSQDGPSTVALGLRDPTELLAQGIIENLRSREVAEIIIDELGLTPPPPPTGWSAVTATLRNAGQDLWSWLRYGYVARPNERAAMAEAVSKAVQANLVRGSYHLHLAASWENPQVATDLANASARALVTHARRVAAKADTERRLFVEAQMLESRRRVDEARRTLLDYSGANGIVASESLRTMLASFETSLSAQRENERAISEARRRQTVIQEQLQAVVPTTQSVQTAEGSTTPAGGAVRSTVPNPAYQTLQSTIAGLRQEIAALEVGLADGPAESRAERERSLAEMRQRLSVAEGQLRTTNPTLQTVQTADNVAGRNSSTTTTTSPNALYQSLQERLTTAQQEVASLEARQAQLVQEVRQNDQALRQLTARDGQLAALGQELSLASEAYSRRTAQWYAALFEEARPTSPIRLIDRATPPLYPVYPIKVIWALIGAATGLLLTVGLIVARHATDLAVRNPADAATALDLPLLTVLPTAQLERQPARWFGQRQGGDR